MIICSSPKGGSGCSVVAAAIARRLAEQHPTVLVDAVGDQPALWGRDAPEVGLRQWQQLPAEARSTPDRLSVALGPVDLLPAGEGSVEVALERSVHEALAAAWPGRSLVVDVGTGAVSATSADRVLLITRPCYLAMRKAAERRHGIDGVVLLVDDGRLMRGDDVEAVVGAPVLAALPSLASVARAVDSGRFDGRVNRWSRSIDRVLEQLAGARA